MKNNAAILAIYVDDGIIFGKKRRDLEEILKRLKTVFDITCSEIPDSFLGLEIHKSRNEIKIGQRNYIEKILETYRMNESNPVDTSMIEGTRNE